MRIHLFLLLAILGLAACESPTLSEVLQQPIAASGTAKSEVAEQADRAAQNFLTVLERVEPVAERICLQQRKTQCDFQIIVDDRSGQSPNAFQTVDRRGRPMLVFNIALLASVRNPDELAFVMGHEASHHILRHLEQQQAYARAGAEILSGIVAVRGANSAQLKAAQQLGAQIGARSFSKDFELEADRLGTRISLDAGFDPVLGAQFFNRLPDPGNRFLGTHPPNTQRMDIVKQTVAGL